MTSEAIVAAKAALRRQVLSVRDALSQTEREHDSRFITDRLLSVNAVAAASTVAAYMSFGSEFATEAFVQAVLERGKRLALPRVIPGTRALQFHLVRKPDAELVRGPWDIREPDPACCPAIDVANLDLLLIPGVAFTRRCERLGYGGGFYDGVIGAARPDAIKVAAAFSVQVVEEIPLEAHDALVDMVVTEKETYRLRSR